jgi:hypothetical protein
VLSKSALGATSSFAWISTTAPPMNSTLAPPEVTAVPSSINYNLYGANGYTTIEGQFEAFILICICIVAIVGNVAFWYVVCSDGMLRTTSNALVLCLSMADILVSVVNMPLTIVTILKHDWIFDEVTCVATGFLNMTTFIASVMSLATISMNRYILVCHPARFKSTYTKPKSSAMIVGK